jgi:hypothetical protein
MTAFDTAWEVVKGQSSDFDWFRPGWKRQIETANEMKTILGEKPARTSLTGETPSQVIDRFTQEDLENDAMDNPNPAVNDALESIGEPNLSSRRRGPGNLGNKVGAELQSLNQQRREGWPELSSRHPDVIE